MLIFDKGYIGSAHYRFNIVESFCDVYLVAIDILDQCAE
tara:strand:- start:1893 stop:2009 length:117 start_codon:yes stop_codon:yes gene_type:complete